MKESRTIKRKLEKRGNNDDKIKGFYWKRDMKINSIKDEFYDKSRFEETSDFIKDKQGNFLFSHSDQLNRFAEHYSELVSDVTQHSLNNEYRVSLFQTNPNNNPTWDINDSITMEEIQNTVLDMKNNKTPGPDGIPIEFFKAFFIKSDLSDNQNDSSVDDDPDCAKCLLLLFNKIWDGDFPEEWNSASIISIPKKGDFSDCNNYRGISLITLAKKLFQRLLLIELLNMLLNINLLDLNNLDLEIKKNA